MLSSLLEIRNVWRVPADARFRITETELGHRPDGFRFNEHIVNVRAESDGTTAEGHGEDRFDLGLARLKAEAEAAERLTMLQQVRREGRPTSSNGWAAHLRPELAKQNAIYEILERDAVLSNWHVRASFHQVAELPLEIQKFANEELAKSEFPILRVLTSTLGLGPSVSVILMNEKGFGVAAHASAPTLEAALPSAITEACRAAHLVLRFEFLEETRDLFAGRTERVYQPGAHSAAYAYHQRLPEWIFGDKIKWEAASALWTLRASRAFDDALATGSFNERRLGRFFVCHARVPVCQDVYWGPTSPNLNKLNLISARPNQRPDGINLEPHFVG